jgi:hypothetical protein
VKSKRKNLLILAAALAVLTLLTFARLGNMRGWWAKSDGHVAAEETRTSSPTAQSPTTEAFDRLMVRNIGTVPFVELFDLLRSASPKIRAEWIKQLDEMPEGPQSAVVLSSFYKTFVQLDPHAAAESIAGLHKKYSQLIAVSAMVGAVPQSAMGEMAAMLVKLPSDVFGRGSPNYLENVISDWSAVDPSAAARFLEENPEASVHYAESLLLNWAHLEPDEAKAWLERQPESVQTEDAFDGLINGWFQRDEANASAFVVAHSGEEKFKRAINDVAFALLLRSPEEARTFLLRLPNEVRSVAIHDIGMNATGPEFNAAMSGMRPAEDIARWIITLPKESWRAGMGMVLDHWESQNAAGFSAWLDQLPPDTRDEVVPAYCFSGIIKEPDRAIPLLLGISDPTRRDQTLREYIADRLPSSRDKAIAVINKSALSQAQKNYVINLLTQG